MLISKKEEKKRQVVSLMIKPTLKSIPKRLKELRRTQNFLKN